MLYLVSVDIDYRLGLVPVLYFGVSYAPKEELPVVIFGEDFRGFYSRVLLEVYKPIFEAFLELES